MKETISHEEAEDEAIEEEAAETWRVVGVEDREAPVEEAVEADDEGRLTPLPRYATGWKGAEHRK